MTAHLGLAISAYSSAYPEWLATLDSDPAYYQHRPGHALPITAKIHECLKGSRKSRLQQLTLLVGREIRSTKELTIAEAVVILNFYQKELPRGIRQGP